MSHSALQVVRNPDILIPRLVAPASRHTKFWSWRLTKQEGSYLRMVLSRVERASLWKVMMMLVGGRSLQYISSVHLGKERQETRRTAGGKAGLRGWKQGHHGDYPYGQDRRLVSSGTAPAA